MATQNTQTLIAGDPFKLSWVSAAVLALPQRSSDGLRRGVLLLNYVDSVVELFPQLSRLFYLVERRGWFGLNKSYKADIKLVEDPDTFADTRRYFPDSLQLEIGPADFVDHHAFRPLAQETKYDCIQISCWSPRKRIELFIEAAALLPHRRFVHLGHFENNACPEELAYRDRCLRQASRDAPNIHFPVGQCRSNDDLPTQKSAINHWINQASVGVLTTQSEGINRFKMECLAADRPVLVPEDVQAPTRKHINQRTGMLYPPSRQSLAAAIEETLSNRERFAPRTYLLSCTGKDRSMLMLREALRVICERDKQPFVYQEIDWDGRNESMWWGDTAIRNLRDLLALFA